MTDDSGATGDPRSDEEMTIELVGTFPIRVRANEQFTVMLTRALKPLGVDDSWSLLFNPEMVAELGGLLPALCVDDRVTGRNSVNGRAIIKENQQSAFSTTVLGEWLAALGYDPEDVADAAQADDRHPYGIKVYISRDPSNPMLVFEKPDERNVHVDVEEFEAKGREFDREAESGRFATTDGADPEEAT